MSLPQQCFSLTRFPRWTQYIVAIIDAGVLVLLFFTFEETMFPRFIFETIQGVLPVTEGRSSPTESATEGKDVDKKDLGRVTTVRSEAHNVQQRDYPCRTYVQKLKLWVYFPEDKTTYMQYFRRPFALFLFPNVVISGCIFAFGCTGQFTRFPLRHIAVLTFDSWHRFFQYYLRDINRAPIRLEHIIYRPRIPCCSCRQLRRMGYWRLV